MRRPELHPVTSWPIWVPIVMLAMVPAGLVVLAVEAVFAVGKRWRG